MSDVSLDFTIDPPTVSTAEVQGNFEKIRDHINGDSWIEDAKLASPNNPVYKTLLFGRGLFSPDAVQGTYLLHEGAIIASSGAYAVTTGMRLPALVDLAAADHVVSGLTTKLRVKGAVRTNGTAPAATFTFGLYPVTWSGAADVLTVTPGTVVTGSTAAVAAPAANSKVSGVGTDFTFPVDGDYCLGLALSVANLANNAAAMVTVELQKRNV